MNDFMYNVIQVSVIVPTYKPLGYLQECLDSIKNQAFRKDLYEVILVLNGEQEPYKSQIESYIHNNKDINIVFVYTSQSGVSNARNIALDIAKGKYITFIDDDDYVSPSYLEELYLKASPEVVSLCYALSFYDGDKQCFPYSITNEYIRSSTDDVCHFFKVRRFFNGPVYKLIHRDIIGERRFDPSFRNGEDSLFMFLISDRIDKVSFTSVNAVYYRRIRQNSATTSKKSLKSVVTNVINLIISYTRIYITAVRRYNMLFYVTRVLAALKSLK